LVIWESRKIYGNFNEKPRASNYSLPSPVHLIYAVSTSNVKNLSILQKNKNKPLINIEKLDNPYFIRHLKHVPYLII
jgi:hypothetical protein